MGKIWLFILFLLPISPLFAQQEVSVDAYFTQDSAKLGERVGYVLKANYPSNKQLTFPDTTFDFSPFVLLEKKTFISSTTEGITQDSTIYFLSNFSLDPSSYLTLPVFELSRYDSITHFPLEAELKLKLTLDSIPEQLVFKENNVYQPIEKRWNWILLGLSILAFLVFVGILYWLFADRVKRFWHKNSLKKQWSRFEKEWTKSTIKLETEKTTQAGDELLGLWKGYLEQLTGLPVKEWTASEIGVKLNDPKVFSSLRSVEILIYAGKTGEYQEANNYLLEFARTKYQEKLIQLKHDRATK
ncbi:hypothetical protein SAMN04488104_101713 [Algoriphagus faecimaris]|uniref:Oxygen tolerance n=1 Tax=Algoriphagus faecimaris TaxID=686796 RepID=A0A1G6SH17_9BACT|nr:hypothetical protein [Algoriphagus faecimaris]SDD16168.1 hypothetical protein SAMN04488104_101713 [Algoriphagus faecimaris]